LNRVREERYLRRAMKLGLFTAEQVCELCKISSGQLSYWDKTEFFEPRYADDLKRPFNRVYSFRDVVGLRTVGLLRSKYNVSLSDLRRISEDLKKTPDGRWSKLVFYLGEDGRVYFRHPEDGANVAAHPSGQRPSFKMHQIIRDVERDLTRMNKRKPEQLGKIDQNPYVAGNAPVVAGTRIPTAAIYRLHEAGYTARKIISEFPRLTRADVEAAIRHERLRFAG
jgi:uncharacterized protein (DUF433 family)